MRKSSFLICLILICVLSNLKSASTNTPACFSIYKNKAEKITRSNCHLFNGILAEVITGTIQDKHGQPISGVTVQVKGTAVGTTTNERGEFRINASRNSVLIISSSGYQTREVLLKDIDGRIVVVLEESFNNMEEVIVVGYGTMRRKDVTVAIISINGEEMQKASTSTFQDAFQ